MDPGAEGGGGAESSADNPAAEGQGGLQRVFHCHQCSRKTFPNAEHIEVRNNLRFVFQLPHLILSTYLRTDQKTVFIFDTHIIQGAVKICIFYRYKFIFLCQKSAESFY